MHEIVKYFILTEIRLKIVNFRSRSDRGIIPRDLAHSTAYLRRGIAASQLENKADAEVALAKATQLDPSPRHGNG